MAKKATSRRKARLGLGVPLGLLIAFAIVVPGLTQEAIDEPKDPGKELALSAGCDLSTDDVAMSVGEFDYLKGAGADSLEDAVLEFSGYLSDSGLEFSSQSLQAAANKAESTMKSDVATVQLPGVVFDVTRNDDGKYVVSQVVQCA